MSSSDLTSPTSVSLRSPLIWLLFPWIMGIHFSYAFFECSLWLLIGISGVLILIAYACLNRLKRWFHWFAWGVFFFLSTFFLSIVWQIENHPCRADLDLSELPPREIYIELVVESVNSRVNPGESGRVQLEAWPVVGQKMVIPLEDMGLITCFLHQPADCPSLFSGDIIRVRGVLYPSFISPEPRVEIRKGTILNVVSCGTIRKSRGKRYILNKVVKTFELGEPEGAVYSGLICSIMTGDKQYLPIKEKRVFQVMGVMHFLAISGFHLSIIAMMIFCFAQLIGLSGNPARLVTFFACLGYVWLTGSSVSAQRALIMLGIYFSSRLFRRKPDLLATTITSAWVILLIDPNQLYDLGFQLSFIIVIGLITHAIPLQRLLSRISCMDNPLSEMKQSRRTVYTSILDGLRVYFIGAISVSWTAFWVSLPLVFFYFGNLPYLAIILNPLIAPLFALVLITGMLSIASNFLFMPALSEFLNHAIWLLLSCINACISSFSQLPIQIVDQKGNELIAIWGVLVITLLLLGVQISHLKNKWIFFVVPVLSTFSVGIQSIIH